MLVNEQGIIAEQIDGSLILVSKIGFVWSWNELVIS